MLQKEKNGPADVRAHFRTSRTRLHLKIDIRTHPHTHFWKIFRTYLHKNCLTRTCARAHARTHTKGLWKCKQSANNYQIIWMHYIALRDRKPFQACFLLLSVRFFDVHKQHLVGPNLSIISNNLTKNLYCVYNIDVQPEILSPWICYCDLKW